MSVKNATKIDGTHESAALTLSRMSVSAGYLLRASTFHLTRRLEKYAAWSRLISRHSVYLFFILTFCFFNALADPGTDPIQLLRGGHYKELERKYAEVQDSYERGLITDEDLRASFRVFYSVDARLESKYADWVEQMPKSYIAHLARGIYYKKLGFERRGDDFIGETRTIQIAGMEDAFSKSSKELAASFSLTRKPVLSFLHSMDISRAYGNAADTRNLLDRSLRIDSRSFIVREKYMGTLQTRWGGGLEQMKAFLAECNNARLSASHMQRLQALVLEEQGWLLEYNEGDHAAAEGYFRRAAALDTEHCLPCINGELASSMMKQSKFEDAIYFLTEMLKTAPDDSVALSNRGAAYFQIGRVADAFADWNRAGEQGDTYSQIRVRELYKTGIPGVMPPKPDLDVNWIGEPRADGKMIFVKRIVIVQGDSIRFVEPSP